MGKTIKQEVVARKFLNDPIDYNKSFSRGIRINLGNSEMLFISGTASVDEKGKSFARGDFTLQLKRVFYNLTGLLKSEGADWNNVVKTTCYLKSMKQYGAFNATRNKFYQEQKIWPFPASVCVQAKLCRPELLVEIELIATIPLRSKNVKK